MWERLAGYQPQLEQLQRPMRRGFLALDHDPGFDHVALASERQSWVGEFERQVADGNWEDRAQPLHPADKRALDSIISLIEGEGLKLVLLVAPRVTSNTSFYDGRDSYRDHVVIAVNYPGRFPQLYEPKVRFNPRHLNAEGAALLSEILAEEFASRVVRSSD